MGAVRAGEPPGHWVRCQRVAAGLTQEDLAERSGVSVRTIADLERGRTRRPYPSSLRALVRALGLPDAAGADLVARYRAVVGRSPVPAGVAAADEVPGPAAGQGTPTAVPRQLPTGVPHFVGRVSELELLDAMLDEIGGGASSVVISAIGGTAGVGKTALALHWAHRIARHFPDGQLYANLRGFDSCGQPADPPDVLRRFLGALQVRPEQIPADGEALAATFRSLLVGRRMLILLDNAADVAQVRPLLPASPGCLVIVTSRRELTPLAAHEGVQLVRLDPLTAAEAGELLTARLGRERVAAEPAVIDQLSALCARLPLALSVIAARAIAQQHLPLAALAGELTEIQSRLDALEAGDPAANVRTVFSWSYRHLPEAAARMFRLLGLHPGPDISVAAAASIAGAPLAVARATLRDLSRASLITENAPGRYSFHDLLRVYAAEQAARGPDGERSDALHRVLDHYLHTAHRAHVVLYPGRVPIDVGTPLRLAAPQDFAAKAVALAWLEAEHQVLLKVIDVAMREALYEHAWRLPVVLWTFHVACGRWHEGVRAHRTALDAARRLGEEDGQARALCELGSIHAMLGFYGQANACLSQARGIFRERGDKFGLARADVMLGNAFEVQGKYAEALAAAREALELAESAHGDPDMQAVLASALNSSAWINAHLGDFGQARADCLQAMELCRSLGYSYGEAGTWDTLGYVWQRLGDHTEAKACFLRAVSLHRDTRTRFDLADSLAHLGDTYRSTGDLLAARQAWTEALTIFEDLRHRSAIEVRARLESLESAG
jgi:tetratricopeptide (TPR) repeat protein